MNLKLLATRVAAAQAPTKTGFAQIDTTMEKTGEFLLSKNILKNNISEYRSFFKKIEVKEAHEREISVLYNYVYTGKTLYFLSHKVNNLSLSVKDDIIKKVHFEISYSDKKIFRDLIAEYGYPGSGHVNPDLPLLDDPERGRKDRDNYLYENYTGLTWPEDEQERYMHITNLINNRYFIEQESKLWVSFNTVKHLGKDKKSSKIIQKQTITRNKLH